MKFYKINDKLVKASSLQNAIILVKDSVASDIVKAITGMGRGFKLTKQMVVKLPDKRHTVLNFKSEQITEENKERVKKQLSYIFSTLGFKQTLHNSYNYFSKKENNTLITLDCVMSFDEKSPYVSITIDSYLK